MPNSHLKMLKQQHFLHQRKNLYNPVSKRSSELKQTQRIITSVPDRSLFLFPQHRTLYLLVWQWGGILT